MAATEALPLAPETPTGGAENGVVERIDEPFARANAEQRRASHRYSALDLQSFAQNQPTASPSAARRALEAHLSETDRRLAEASRLGTALVQQRSMISDRLKDVEQLQNESEIGPELKQKLVDIEKEYNELGRESVRVSMAPKGRHSVDEATNGQIPHSGRPASPTKFSSQAVDSPSKVNVPSRKQRNQPANRNHDIEFVTDISTSLLVQVRQLQGALVERDDAIKGLTNEKSQLELESRGLAQRLKTLDESEQRYKDENWNLETQTHDLLAAAKDRASKEQKLQQGLTAALAEKTAAQRELDEVKQALGKLGEDHTSFRKHQESELATLRKNVTSAETSRDALQKKIEEMTAQNEELAKAVAGRYRIEGVGLEDEMLPEPEETSLERSDVDHSPPPSPQKQGARNNVLESETLKSSLHHAHRMIQSLKKGISQERSEKKELSRMLQESRDELEARRNGLGSSAGSRNSKAKGQQSAPKKMPKQGHLGASRSGRLYIEEDDPAWEEHAGDGTPQANSRGIAAGKAKSGNASEAYQTAAETDAFETANERESTTETEAFQTGAESMADESSGELTEKEAGTAQEGPARASRVPVTKRQSYLSTASTSDEELGSENATPSQPPAKYKLKMGRGYHRLGASPSTVRDSPASVASNGTPQGPGQSLFAELGELGAEGSEEEVDETPSKVRGTTLSPRSIGAAHDASSERSRPKAMNADAGTMTDPWESQAQPADATSAAALGRLPHTIDQTASRKEQSEAALATSTKPQERAQGMMDSAAPSTLTGSGAVPVPRLSFSKIQSTEIEPSTVVSSDRDQTSAASQVKKDAAKGGLIGSVLGWAVGSKAGASTTSPADSVGDGGGKSVERTSIGDAANAPQLQTSPPTPKEVVKVSLSDQASQTALSASEIDRMLSDKESKHAAVAAASTYIPSKPRSSSASLVVREPPQLSPARASLSKDQPPTRAVRRPNSSGSFRTSSDDVPPLPAHHQQAIAAAQQTPSKSKTEGSMGPPLMPASAYRPQSRRPQTPQDQGLQSPGSATPRARYSTARSMRSRRSSVSSFESELDARFNIRPDGMPMRGMDTGTDPRMIQAITQTMIGEYLWKYTRKAGRGEMSGKRHRRFFWVHPYTRTLYWSDQDPSQAGRAQLKAKSVAIEAVRVVVDDNPMPPGLHRKSLLVITPGRDVKFTASTGQRHETWFNALSYLLLRSGPDQGDAGLTPEEMAEFNPQATGNPLRSSRVSLASYQSRSHAGAPPRSHSRASSRDPSPSKAASAVRGSIPAMPHANSGGSSTGRYSRAGSSLSSRLSSYWRPGGGTVRQSSSRLSSHAGAGEGGRASASLYNPSVANDSAEDARQALERQEQEADRLENVRACCDGKHDVGSLNRRSQSTARMSGHAGASRASTHAH